MNDLVIPGALFSHGLAFVAGFVCATVLLLLVGRRIARMSAKPK